MMAVFAGLASLTACGPSAEEIAAKEQAYQDSLQQVEQARLDEIALEEARIALEIAEQERLTAEAEAEAAATLANSKKGTSSKTTTKTVTKTETPKTGKVDVKETQGSGKLDVKGDKGSGKLKID